MLKMDKSTTINFLGSTADDWKLYEGSPVRNEVAALLNASIVAAVNAGKPIEDVRYELYGIMDFLKKTGANDSEPRDHLNSILYEVFGE